MLQNRGERKRRKGRLLSLTSLAWSLVMAVLSSPGLYYLYSTIIPVRREKGEGWRERGGREGGREGGIQLDSTATKCIRMEQIHCKSYMVMLTCNVLAIISVQKQTNCAISEVTQFKLLPILCMWIQVLYWVHIQIYESALIPTPDLWLIHYLLWTTWGVMPAWIELYHPFSLSLSWFRAKYYIHS